MDKLEQLEVVLKELDTKHLAQVYNKFYDWDSIENKSKEAVEITDDIGSLVPAYVFVSYEDREIQAVEFEVEARASMVGDLINYLDVDEYGRTHLVDQVQRFIGEAK